MASKAAPGRMTLGAAQILDTAARRAAREIGASTNVAFGPGYQPRIFQV